MPQDYPSQWFTKSKKPSTIEKWVVELEYNQGATQKQRVFFGTHDTSIIAGGVNYRVYGILTSTPTIAESINLLKGVYKSSDCSFTFDNTQINWMPYSDTGVAQNGIERLDTTALLFGGDYNFINRKVKRK